MGLKRLGHPAPRQTWRSYGEFAQFSPSGCRQVKIVSYAATMDEERNLGEQPICQVMASLNLTPNDLVKASTDQLTHKMVARATRGRRLTTNTKSKVIRALEAASGKTFPGDSLFNY